MMSGTVIVEGDASQYAGATGRGGLVHDLMRAHEVALLQPLLDFLSGRERT